MQPMMRYWLSLRVKKVLMLCNFLQWQQKKIVFLGDEILMEFERTCCSSKPHSLLHPVRYMSKLLVPNKILCRLAGQNHTLPGTSSCSQGRQQVIIIVTVLRFNLSPSWWPKIQKLLWAQNIILSWFCWSGLKNFSRFLDSCLISSSSVIRPIFTKTLTSSLSFSNFNCRLVRAPLS